MADHRRRRGGLPPLDPDFIVWGEMKFTDGSIDLGTNFWVPDPPPPPPLFLGFTQQVQPSGGGGHPFRRLQRPTESSDLTQHAKGRTGDRPGPRKGATTRRNVTQGGTPNPPQPHLRARTGERTA